MFRRRQSAYAISNWRRELNEDLYLGVRTSLSSNGGREKQNKHGIPGNIYNILPPAPPGSHYIVLSGLLTSSLPLPPHAEIKGHYAQH